MVSPLMPEPEKEWGGLCAALGCELLLSGGRHNAVINVVRLQAGISALWGPARLSAQCFLRMDYLQLMFNSSNERAPQPGKRSAGAALLGLQKRGGVWGGLGAPSSIAPSLGFASCWYLCCSPSCCTLRSAASSPQARSCFSLTCSLFFSCLGCAHLALLPPSPRNPLLDPRVAARGRWGVTALQNVGSPSVVSLTGEGGWAG